MSAIINNGFLKIIAWLFPLGIILTLILACFKLGYFSPVVALNYFSQYDFTSSFISNFTSSLLSKLTTFQNLINDLNLNFNFTAGTFTELFTFFNALFSFLVNCFKWFSNWLIFVAEGTLLVMNVVSYLIYELIIVLGFIPYVFSYSFSNTDFGLDFWNSIQNYNGSFITP